MKSLFGIGQHVTIALDYKRRDGLPITTANVKTKLGETETLPLYTNKDSVCGDVLIAPVGGKKVGGPQAGSSTHPELDILPPHRTPCASMESWLQVLHTVA